MVTMAPDCLAAHRNEYIIAMGLNVGVRMLGALIGYKLLGGGFAGVIGAWGGWTFSAPIAQSLSGGKLQSLADQCAIADGGATGPGPRIIDL